MLLWAVATVAFTAGMVVMASLSVSKISRAETASRDADYYEMLYADAKRQLEVRP